jgi:oligopeptidase A
MEHCLFSESVLAMIMECTEKNQGPQTLTPEMIEKLHVWRNHRKVKQIMQHVFFGAFELDLFSSFDPSGDESLVGLQRRLATQYVPHDMPNPKDLSPFQDIIAENARGTHIAFYRYLWCEVYSAGLYRSFSGALLGESPNVREHGATFRRDFLDPGALLDPEKALRKFGGEEAMLDLFQVPRS